MSEVFQWEDIRGNFSDCLIVGNGGSIAISSNFSYKKLYQWGRDNEHIKKAAQEIFEHFSASQRDFERILNKLNQADFINKKVDITKSEQNKVRKAYTDVRRSLIDTVKGLHPEWAEVKNEIDFVRQYLSNFNTIFSLNYDLLIHWATQTQISLIDSSDVFDDGFSKRDNVKNSTSLLFDYKKLLPTNDKTTQLYFPHGNLLLYSTKLGDEKKITANHKKDLLTALTKAWANNGSQPLFICEGDSHEKLKQINTSSYLSHVYHQALPKAKENVTIYGWSMGTQDNHLLAQLKQANPMRVAVSIYTGQDIESQEKEMKHALTALKNEVGINSNNVTFFDSQSAGAWNQPSTVF
ncbi:DUF4917 family protein [Catenovulum maritimum]|uniref:DUF4917 domain-containing protein n=1 Tax=Catenovulum maritimum TaxID=1513271 RepID=A0A0J8GVZ1_9ALTE|nr:DUF4917 family protein [Catenovulum maritimum]KMT66927.1 hypothetical protein XM47_02155 [Catenovulum maritimum]